MDTIVKILTVVGYGSSIIVLVTVFVSIFLWWRVIFPVLLRLGNGLAKRKIAIFAKGDNLMSLKNLLLDSKLFKKTKVVEISVNADIGKAEAVSLFLVSWPDWGNDIVDILNKKKDGTALIVYAPQDKGFIPNETIAKLNNHRNVTITNFRGRLLNDLVVSMITTSYDN